MSRHETGGLRKSWRWAIHDQGHEKQRQREVLGIEGDDEERHFARGIVLGIRVRVCERKRREEGVRIQEVPCERLEASQRRLLLDF